MSVSSSACIYLLTPYIEPIASSDGGLTVASIVVSPSVRQFLTHCSAASKLEPIFRHRGSSRSPSELNKRSQSQLLAGVTMRLIAKLESSGYLVRNLNQYWTGLTPLMYCSSVQAISSGRQSCSWSKPTPSLVAIACGLRIVAIRALIEFDFGSAGCSIEACCGRKAAQSCSNPASPLLAQSFLSSQLLSK